MDTLKKTALLFGATGLTGSYLLDQLLLHPAYHKVRVFVRSPLQKEHPRLEIIHFEPEELEDMAPLLKGDQLFCCIGSTIRKAGSQSTFRHVDFDLPVKLGQLAKKNAVGCMVVISSLGANEQSKNFYLHTKGEMEVALQALQMPNLIIARPSILMGKREEKRPGEKLGKMTVNLISPLLIGKLRKYKGIHAEKLARALINLANQPLPHQQVYESDELLKWSKL